MRGRRLAVSLAAVIVCLGVVTGGLVRLGKLSLPVSSGTPRAVAAEFSPASVKSPPVRVCGNKAILGGGPATAPKGAVVIPAGDDSRTVLAHNWTVLPHKTYWFAPGVHTLGAGQYSQIIPAAGDTFEGAPGAVIDGQHSNLYAFTQTAPGVTIRYLTIQHFGPRGANGGQSVINSDAAPGWRVSHVTLQGNAGAAVMVGTGNVLAYSCLRDNGEYGFQAAGARVTIDHDEVTGNNADNWEVRDPGCGCSGGAKFWDVNQATVTSNYVHDNRGPGLWADTNNRGFDVSRNYISGNEGEGFIYEISYNLRLADNTFVRNALPAGPKLGGFPDPAVYISESGADPRVPGAYGKVLAITGNTFTDNWSGVVLWQSPTRFCGSPGNTSTGYCTLVAPAATVRTCGNRALIGKQPYYGDCLWSTQNVLVSHNVFNINPAHIGPDCTAAAYCGFNGIFSQEGAWRPYLGNAIEDAITFSRNNHFTSNTYRGPWRFVVHQQGNTVSWSTWQGSPYRQDAGSTITGGGD